MNVDLVVAAGEFRGQVSSTTKPFITLPIKVDRLKLAIKKPTKVANVGSILTNIEALVTGIFHKNSITPQLPKQKHL